MSIPTSSPDLHCPVCREPFVVTGETLEQRAAAVRDWRGCCIQTPDEALRGEADASSGHIFEPQPLVRTRTALLALVVAVAGAPFVVAFVMRA